MQEGRVDPICEEYTKCYNANQQIVTHTYDLFATMSSIIVSTIYL